MRRSGRIARTSWTSALMVAAERGSRLPWARATRAGAAISAPSSHSSSRASSGCFRDGPRRRWRDQGLGSWGGRSPMDAALGLVRTCPATAARVLAGGDPAGARRAADGGVAVVHERVHQDVVLGDVPLDVLVAPAGQRGHLDLALLGVPADDRRDDPVVGLGPAQAGGPRVVLGQRTLERLHL